MIRVGDLVQNMMLGDETCDRVGIVSQIIPYALPSNQYLKEDDAISIDYSGVLHKDEYSCIVIIDGEPTTCRAKWLKVISERK